ncbi:MATE family multidrug resistance protein [Paenibacillus forsythiae]|uniref:MATE family multidrug resistance protein n=1 Tax=Paenibacillus forsythiae TaxID=365616 RepID=A0ABU3H632_9BACL|nr:MATE family efflux transporter [Paenibacillus forsythiae]MDT3426283.1 MATE family multidrug resistance protein [Paenibacillus forsythiae]
MSELMDRPSHRAYLMLGIPLMISSLTTPLLGAVDTAVVGHLFDPSLLGGTAIAILILNTLFWLFGFLRVSTSGFAAQARGSGDISGGMSELIRPLVVAGLMGVAMIALKEPILQSALSLMRPEPDVARWARVYFEIRILGAPLTLLNYALLGWLMGMSHIKYTLTMQLSTNVLNIAFSLLFVQGLHWGVAGVAGAAVLAEGLAFLLGVILALRSPYMNLSDLRWTDSFKRSDIRRMFRTNGDLFVRTVCLLAMFNLFTASSTAFGTRILAANTILLQIHYLMAYCFDGLANASSIYAGQARGSGNCMLLKRTLYLSWIWGGIASIGLAGAYLLSTEHIISLFTDNDSIKQIAMQHGGWLLLFPLVTGFGLVFYGVFTGLTETAPIRNSMLLSLTVYALSLLVFVPAYGNHGLWLSFILFGLGRSVFLLVYVLKFKLAAAVKERPIAELYEQDHG